MCSVQLAVTLHSPASGRYMDLYTNMPGLQLYSGNNLNGSTVGKGAYPYPIYGGMAIETQVGNSISLLWPYLVSQVWPRVSVQQTCDKAGSQTCQLLHTGCARMLTPNEATSY